MTAQETVDAFEHYIDQFSTARPPDTDFWINNGIEFFVKMKISGYLSTPNTGFQKNQRVRDEISDLVKSDVSLSYVSGVAAYPDDCFELIPNSIGCSNVAQSIKENTHIWARARTWDWYYSNQKNPFTKPKFKSDRLAYIESNDGINIFPPLEYTDVIGSYVKEWVPFNLIGDDPIDLRDKAHRVVTKIAAAQYLMSIQNDLGAKSLMEQVMIE